MANFIHQRVETIRQREYATSGIDDMKLIEIIARNCYKSEHAITESSYINMIKMLLKKKHLGMFEPITYTIRIITNRGISHQLVRHRLCSFAQESQRYCNYSKEKFDKNVNFIYPYEWDERSMSSKLAWREAMQLAENYYMELLDCGWKPEDARGVLPNDTKTEIIITANLREWMHIFDERLTPEAQPMICELMKECHLHLAHRYPIIFGKEN